jgi:hypothetical protein
VVRGSFERLSTANIVSDTERVKNAPISICTKTAFVVELQQEVGELVISIRSCPSIIILENTLN